jgi:hypothetical protein
MRESERILEVLAEIRRLNPSQRFGQLVGNISFLAKGPIKSATYDVEDEEFLEAAASYLENLKHVGPNHLSELNPAAEKTQ